MFKPRLHFQVAAAIHLNVGVPPRIMFAFSRASTGAIADGITGVAERVLSDAADLSCLIVVKSVLALSRKQSKEAVVPQVLHVGPTALLFPRPSPFGCTNVVLVDQFLIDNSRVFVLGNLSRYVPPIAAGDKSRRSAARTQPQMSLHNDTTHFSRNLFSSQWWESCLRHTTPEKPDGKRDENAVSHDGSSEPLKYSHQSDTLTRYEQMSIRKTRLHLLLVVHPRNSY